MFLSKENWIKKPSMQANLKVKVYSAGPSPNYSSGQKDGWKQIV